MSYSGIDLDRATLDEMNIFLAERLEGLRRCQNRERTKRVRPARWARHGARDPGRAVGFLFLTDSARGPGDRAVRFSGGQLRRGA